MKLISNTGDSIELYPEDNSRKSLKLIDPIHTKIPGILRYLNMTTIKRAELVSIFGKGTDALLRVLKNWGLIDSVATYYSLTSKGEKYYNIIKNKNFLIFNEIN